MILPPPFPPRSPFALADDAEGPPPSPLPPYSGSSEVTLPDAFHAPIVRQLERELHAKNLEIAALLRNQMAALGPPPSSWQVAWCAGGMAGKWLLIAVGALGIAVQFAAQWWPELAYPFAQLLQLIVGAL